MLPGQAALSWVGSQPPADALLAGELSLQAGELRPLLAWLGLAQEDLPAGGLTSLDLIADAAVGTGRLSLRRIRARLDASQVEGSVDYAGSPRPRVELALTADRVNTALYQAPPTGWANWRSRLELLDGTLDLAVDRLSHDILRGRGFRLRAALDGGRLDLPELRVADLAGVGLTLAGAVDLALGAWDLGGTLASSDPKLLLRLLRFEPPPEIDRLAPLRLEAQSSARDRHHLARSRGHSRGCHRFAERAAHGPAGRRRARSGAHGRSARHGSAPARTRLAGARRPPGPRVARGHRPSTAGRRPSRGHDRCQGRRERAGRSTCPRSATRTASARRYHTRAKAGYRAPRCDL